MKRLTLLSLLAILTLSGMAQPAYRRPAGRSYPIGYLGDHRGYTGRYFVRSNYLGLRVGLGVSTIRSDDRYLNGASAKPGLNLGFVTGFQLAPITPIYLETGLLYTEKGGKGNYNGKFSYKMDYLEVPLLMKYHIYLGRLTSVQPFAGVYGALGVGGKMKDFDQREAYSSFSKDAFRRLDGGLRLGCGLQYDHLYAELGYDLGLANVSHDYFDTSHTGSFFANIGLNF